MQFVYPNFLYALGFLTIPILIHLFQFRITKTIYFSNIKWLETLTVEQTKRSQLKHLLVLLARLLAILFLVLAFAKPFIPVKGKPIGAQQDELVSIYIDNSFSMASSESTGANLEIAKKMAKAIISDFPSNGKFCIMTNEKWGAELNLLTKEASIRKIDEIQIGPDHRTLQQIEERFQLVLKNNQKSKGTLCLISDFQCNAIDDTRFTVDAISNHILVPLAYANKNNVGVDSCWFNEPIQRAGDVKHLHIRIHNYGKDPAPNIPLKVFVNNIQKAAASYNLKGNTILDTTVSFRPLPQTAIQNLKVSITDYPVAFDNAYYASFKESQKINLMVISGQSNDKIFQSLLAKDSSIKTLYFNDGNIDYGKFDQQNAIVLNQLNDIPSGLAESISKFVDAGGSVLVIPSEKIEILAYNYLLNQLNISGFTALDTTKTAVNKINYETPFFKNVFEKTDQINLDLPWVKQHYKKQSNLKQAEEMLLQMRGGDPFCSHFQHGKGHIYVFTVALSPKWTNFANHALFVPICYQAFYQSKENNINAYTIGKDAVLETNKELNPKEKFLIFSNQPQIEIIPAQMNVGGKHQILWHDQLKVAGNYYLGAEHDSIIGIAMNYDRQESDLSVVPPAALEKKLASLGLSNIQMLQGDEKHFTAELSALIDGKPLWKLCIIFVLIFLAFETLLLRFWKG